MIEISTDVFDSRWSKDNFVENFGFQNGTMMYSELSTLIDQARCIICRCEGKNIIDFPDEWATNNEIWNKIPDEQEEVFDTLAAHLQEIIEWEETDDSMETKLTRFEIRELAISLLNDDHGVPEKGFTKLRELLNRTNNSDIVQAVEVGDGRFYISKDFATLQER